MILTRLLVPEFFGVMALINVLLTGLVLFSDVGIGPSIIQNKLGATRPFLNTAWTIQVMRGLLLWLLSCAVALPAASFYQMPELGTLIPVAGLAALLAGFNSTRLFTANRELLVGRLVLVKIAAQLSSLVVMIYLAWYTRSIWSLVIGGLVQSAALLILSHGVLPGIANRIAWDRGSAHELFSFGKWIFISTSLTFIAMQGDRFVLGKLIALEALGFYSIALVLALVPRGIVSQVGNRVLFPAVAKMVRSGTFDMRQIRRLRTRTLLFFVPSLAALIALAAPLISILYDERYQMVGRLLPLLAIGAWLNIITISYGICLIALGQPKFISYGTGLRACLFFGLVWPVFGHFGLEGVALLVSLSELGVLGVCMFGGRAIGIATPVWDLAITGLGALLVGVLLLVYSLAADVTGHVLASIVFVGLLTATTSAFIARRIGLV